MAMSSDGLLFEVFSNVHPKFKTPTWGILISGFLAGILSAIFDVNQLVNMISIGTVRMSLILGDLRELFQNFGLTYFFRSFNKSMF